jgi:hypothetical protein
MISVLGHLLYLGFRAFFSTFSIVWPGSGGVNKKLVSSKSKQKCWYTLQNVIMIREEKAKKNKETPLTTKHSENQNGNRQHVILFYSAIV